MSQTCIGCGVRLQSENDRQPGFVPASAINKPGIVCRRCFRLKHYNEVSPVQIGEEQFLRTLHRIGDTEALVVKVIDIFDVTGSWISGLSRFVSFNPILLVANKMDVLPRNINANKLKNHLQQWSRESGIKPVDVLFCSAAKGHGVEQVMQAIEAHRRGKDVYVVGMTNAGKSTFVNDLLRRFEVHEEEWVTTSRFPGTTLDLIRIPLQDDSCMYDTPGIVNRRQMAHYLHPDELAAIMPQKTVKPLVYQLNEEQTLFIGGMARLDFVRGGRTSFVCYFSRSVDVHRTKLPRADEVYRQHVGEMLRPPAKDLQNWPGLQSRTYQVRDENVDVAIAGLGWINIKGRPASGAGSGPIEIRVHAPVGVDVTLRKALI